MPQRQHAAIALIEAAFIYNTAMRDEKLPRKKVPAH